MAERAHPDDIGFRDKWFGLKKNWYKKKLIERYEFCNKFIKDKVVVDVPCGTGWGTSFLKKYKFVTGVDISKEAIDFARERYQKHSAIEFVEGNMQELPFEHNSKDVVLCLEGFEHVAKEIGIAFLKEAKKVLKESGLLIMTCPVLDENGNSTGNPYHVCEYPEKELIEVINANFQILLLERMDGPDGAIYRIVARKSG